MPVPDLAATLDKLKIAVAPFAKNAEELLASIRSINEFGAGFGQVLQRRLEARAKEEDNWLDEFLGDVRRIFSPHMHLLLNGIL